MNKSIGRHLESKFRSNFNSCQKDVENILISKTGLNLSFSKQARKLVTKSRDKRGFHGGHITTRKSKIFSQKSLNKIIIRKIFPV